MSKIVAVAVRTTSKYVSVLKLFLLPVLVAANLNDVRCRAMWRHVVTAISESGMIKMCEYTLESLRHLVTSLRVIVISTSDFVADILSSGYRPMSGNVGCVMSELAVVKNVG